MGRGKNNLCPLLTERSRVDIIKKMILEMNQKDTNTIYLREIAHLMEEIDRLKDELSLEKKLVKKLKLKLQKDKP